jgi:N-methylhydantoinase A/oxoprolinase/acetone carboxylase beta subunit
LTGDALERADLARALGQDDVFFIAGGHAADGTQQATLDEAAIRAAADSTGDTVSAYAVAAHFATRNPAHESRARDLLRELTGARSPAAMSCPPRLVGRAGR